jgi:topoisomerase IV subunit B
MWVEVARNKLLYKQSFAKGHPTSKLKKEGPAGNRRGTTVCFHADPEIFGTKAHFKPAWLYQMARSKAYLYGGVEIRWACGPGVADGKTPVAESFRFPNGLLDFLHAELADRATLTPAPFAGQTNLPDKAGKVEFAIAWPEDGEGFIHSYCNTIPTPQGGTHEQGLRAGLARSLRAYAEMTGNKKTSLITADEVSSGAAILLSLFIRDPQFQGQTKEKLASAEAVRWVDTTIKDHFDHWLSADPAASKILLETIIDRAEERKRLAEDKSLARKSATRKLRLPGKLSDCSRSEAEGTEMFIVEGDSAGGSAKQARNRETQAILPLRGKILNVVSATTDKMRANQEIQDLILALGCGAGKDFNLDALRYEKVIIMTDADVDGAHIASLLITFFYTQMKPLIEQGRLYLAQPPLYRLVSGTLSEYARDDAHKEELMNTTFKGKGKVDISRFKGLGEMPAKQLKETTMNIESRILLRVTLPHVLESIGVTENGPTSEIDDLVERLMGRNADARFQFIQERAEFVQDIDI